jgi:hypothetical protein
LLFIFISYKQLNSVIIFIANLLHVLKLQMRNTVVDPIEAFIFGEGAIEAGWPTGKRPSVED